MVLPKTFIGITNAKWIITEMLKMYSSENSFFSKKRIESGISFIIYQYGSLWYLHNKLDKMDVYDFLMWASAELIICGYTLNMIEKVKTSTPKKDEQ